MKEVVAVGMVAFIGMLLARTINDLGRSRRMRRTRRARRYLHYARELKKAGLHSRARVVRWAVYQGVLHCRRVK
jgi:hypothetical protein